jgi:hypothetical protein
MAESPKEKDVSKETLILMCGDMIRATLAGRKTQTRRVAGDDPQWSFRPRPDSNPHDVSTWDSALKAGLKVSPYGGPGDTLLIKEKHRFQCRDAAGLHVEYAADGEVLSWKTDYEPKEYNVYRNGRKIWRPSIFLPKNCVRLAGKIKEVRLQRLQDISEEDAVSEGLVPAPERLDGLFAPSPAKRFERTDYLLPVEAYRTLWDSLNAKRGYPWDSNPWVWAITYKRIRESY